LGRGAPEAVNDRVPVLDLLDRPDALLTSSDLTELGLSRRAIDAVFRGCPIVSFPDYRRPMIRVADYLAFVESSTYRGDRVRPTGGGLR
jgi:hypothetical protein